jgi:hypothetical protein
VTATHSAPGRSDSSCSGIKKLKRGVTLQEFTQGYMTQFPDDNLETFQRGDTIVVLARKPENVMQWAFTEYKEEDLLHAVRHLSREEMLRDLKELLPLKEELMR